MQHQNPSEFDRTQESSSSESNPENYSYDEATGQYYYAPAPTFYPEPPVPQKARRSWLIPLMGVLSAILVIILVFFFLRNKNNKPVNSPQADLGFELTLNAMSAEVTIQALSDQLTRVAQSSIREVTPEPVVPAQPIESPTDTPTATPDHCARSPFSTGDSAWVERGIDQIELFSTSSSGSSVKDWLSGGDVLLITGPMVCVNGNAMWPVKNTHMVRGWVKETDNGTRQLRRIDTWNACSGRLPTRLTVNGYGFVQEEPVKRNIMRVEPSSSSAEVYRINPGRSFLVLDGPACADGQIWWKIRALYNGKEGWTRESGLDNDNVDDYFIAPKMP